MPGPDATGDALHVAVAAVHEMDYLLSWNVRHLANPNKTRHSQVICQRLGLLPPVIITPDALWERRTCARNMRSPSFVMSFWKKFVR